MEEAVKFAKDTFNIDLLLGNNLKLANMVNLIIVNLSNLLKGKVYLPKVIKMDTLTKHVDANYDYSNQTINISKDVFDTQNFPTYKLYKNIFNSNDDLKKYVQYILPDFAMLQNLKETVTHEFGHCCHAGNNIKKYTSKKFDLKKMLKERYEEAEKFFKTHTGVTVGDKKVYAMTSPDEFVAEGFSIMTAEEVRLPDYIRKVYKKLGGYLPKDF